MPLSEFPGLTIELSGGEPLFKQLYRALRNRILKQQIRSGTRLPSSRVLAKQLGVGRNTIITVFDQLIAEGYLETKAGSGTFVASVLPENWSMAESAYSTKQAGHSAFKLSDYGTSLTGKTDGYPSGNHSFAVGVPDLKAFPYKIWNRISQQITPAGLTKLMGYDEPAGYLPLRQAIADYVRSSRSVNCDASQVLITNGAQQALDLCSRILLNPGSSAAMEEPGYLGTRRALMAAGANLVPCPVDEQGLILESLKSLKKPPQLLCVTPTHQYPLGAMMTLERRIELLDWAYANQCWILEDDYDSEYHYQNRPIASLQGLARHEQVIYIGSFSKVLFQSLRLGYLVLPHALTDIFAKAKRQHSGETALHSQAVTAEFIQEGHFSRHLRRMRLNYKNKLEIMLNACETLKPWCHVHAMGAGMHLALEFKSPVSESTVSQSLLKNNILHSTLSSYYFNENKKHGLVLGFANSNETEIRQGIAVIAEILAGMH